MLVGELMSTPAVAVRPSTTIHEAIRLMDRHRLTAMPVLGQNGALAGILSEADVIGVLVRPDPRAHAERVMPTAGPEVRRVDEVMSRHVVTVPVDADMVVAIALMADTAVKSLPVIDDDRVVGLISRSDIVRTLARADDAIESQLDALLQASGTDWTVEVHDGVATFEGGQQESDGELVQILAGTVPGVVGIRFVTPL